MRTEANLDRFRAERAQRPTIEVVRRGLQKSTPKPGDIVTARVGRSRCHTPRRADAFFSSEHRASDMCSSRCGHFDALLTHICRRPCQRMLPQEHMQIR